MKRMHWGLVVGSLAALATVAVFATRPAPPTSSPPPPPRASAVTPAAPVAVEAPARTGCRFETGQRFDVALSVKAGVELTNAPAPLPRGAVLSESISATARVEVLEADDTRAVLLGELADAKVTGQTPASAYQGPFLLEVAKDCELERYARHDSTQPADARLQQAALWELSFRGTPGEAQLTRHNGRGSYVAKATTGAVGGEVLAQRRLEAYRQLWLGGTATHVTGFSSVKLGASGWFDSFEADETLTSSTGITRTAVRASAKAARGALTIDRDVSHYHWVDLLPKVLSRREARPVTSGDKALRAQMQDKSASEAVQLAQQSFEKQKNLAASWPPLRAFLEAKPELTQEVVQELKRGAVTEDGLNPFFIALGNARTPEARDALLGIMRDDKAPPTVRVRAMFSLVDRADVGPELANELRKSSQALESNPKGSARFIAGESLLALSTMAGLHEDADVREIALSATRTHLRQGADPRSQGTALRALANLGDPALLREAEPFTHASEERVRRAATKVIRRMHPQDADAFAVPWLRREPSLFVKKDLVVTLEAQHFDAQAPASDALTRALLAELADENHGVIARKAMIRLVGGSVIADDPSVRETLKAQAKRALARRDGLASDCLQLLTPAEVREVAP